MVNQREKRPIGTQRLNEKYHLGYLRRKKEESGRTMKSNSIDCLAFSSSCSL